MDLKVLDRPVLFYTTWPERWLMYTLAQGNHLRVMLEHPQVKNWKRCRLYVKASRVSLEQLDEAIAEMKAAKDLLTSFTNAYRDKGVIVLSDS